MRVLHVVPSIDASAGGPSRSVPQLCRALSARGCKITMLTTGRPGEHLAVDPSEASYSVERLTWNGTRLFGAARVFEFIRSRGRTFDLVHIHGLWNSVVTAAAHAARRIGVPYAIAPRGMLDRYCTRRRKLAKRLYALSIDAGVVSHASRLHFLNAAEARNARDDWFDLPPHFVAANGIDDLPQAIPPLIEPLASMGDRRLVVFLGRLHAIKGLELQLEALERVVEKHPRLVWVLVGPDEGAWAALRARVAAVGLLQHVVWTGALHGPERLAVLARADVFLQTSHYECHSVAVNEALAMGAPTVVTDTVNFDEVATSGAGLMVERTPSAVAGAIDRFLTDEALVARARRAGPTYARANLSWDVIAERTKLAYQEILS